ncbi:hypothetical protein DPMN_125163 [Dreissena polymorpha]|uniref:Uncharacterized protein n=1 Tax=Dreissena polymorpha TaxID=45954 RepID=A0A9D4GXR2_DREPO|nr:hypothetical protein DPMN_125163 [Dreissena polymorpha]
MLCTLGDSLIHMSHIDCMVEHDTPLPEIAPIIRTPEINEIARLIADNLVEDGATLQTGMIFIGRKCYAEHTKTVAYNYWTYNTCLTMQSQ